MAESSPNSHRDLAAENEVLRAQLAEAQEVIRAIQSGAVDALVVLGPEGEQVFTLQGAEYAYRALVEAMNEGAATLSPDGVVLYCNQRLADLFEIPEERIIGTPVTKLVAPGSKEEFAALFANALAGESGKAELKVNGADRNSRSAYVSLRRIEGQEPSAICMVVTDLTEHKKRDELIAAGELARSILASAAEAIAVCDNDGVIISANEALRKICGFNPLFQPFDNVLPLQFSGAPEGFARFSVVTAPASEDFRAREVTFRRKDGKLLTLLISAAQVAAPSGIAGCVLTLTEITERKQAEEALRQSEERFRVAQELSPDGFTILRPIRDAQGRVEDFTFVYQNAAIARISGTDPKATVGRRLLEVFPRHRGTEFLKSYQQVAETGEPCVFEAEYVGETIVSPTWFRIAVVPIGSDIAVLAQDITERKRGEQALIRSEKLAALGRMAATVAHEVNNPLAAVMNAIFIVGSDAGLSPQGRSALEIADQELRRAAHITSRTLGFYRDQNNSAPVQLPKIIDEVVSLYARKLQERGINLHRRYRCFRCPGACFVVDAGELRQVFSNLFMNAMDAIRDSGNLHVRLARMSSLRGDGAVIRLTIADTGSGIRAEHLRRIFDPFFTTKERTGTGLGLWISQQIVGKYGGSMRVRSREGKGTVCCVTIPAMTADTSSPECDGAAGVTGHCAALDSGKSDEMVPQRRHSQQSYRSPQVAPFNDRSFCA